VTFSTIVDCVSALTISTQSYTLQIMITLVSLYTFPIVCSCRILREV